MRITSRIKTIIIIALTLVLAALAVLLAFWLYQKRQESIAPTAPESKPEAQQQFQFQGCQDLSFTIAERVTPTPTVEPTTPTTPPSTPTPTPTLTPTPTPTPTLTPTPGGTGEISAGGGKSPAAPPTCNAAKPGSAPYITSAKAGKSSVTLTWSKAKDPVTHYFIVYGRSPGAEEFGANNIGDKNTTSFTVESLSGGTTYYFRIAAVNDCMPGNYSNEVAAQPTGGTLAGPAKGFSKLSTGTEPVELPVVGVSLPTIAFSLAGMLLVLLGIFIPVRRRI